MKTLSKKSITKEDVDAARKQLLEYFEKDTRVYTRLLSASSSGMSRTISLHIARDNQILNITWLASRILGCDLKDVHGSWGIVRKGCGMDMGFSLVNGLSMKLYCPDDCNRDAAYKLRHEWI